MSEQERNNLERALQTLNAEAASFGMRFIQDARVRGAYIESIRKGSQAILEAADSGQISYVDAARMANQMRNELLVLQRMKLSDLGLAISRAIKPDAGVPLNQLIEKYSLELFSRPFNQLTEQQKNRVFARIVEAAGKARGGFFLSPTQLSRLGRGLWMLSLSIAVYNVTTADDKVDALGREAARMGGGVLGSMGLGAAGLACGPAAVVCVPLGIFLGGIAGSLGADHVYDYFKY